MRNVESVCKKSVLCESLCEVPELSYVLIDGISPVSDSGAISTERIGVIGIPSASSSLDMRLRPVVITREDKFHVLVGQTVLGAYLDLNV